MARQHSRRDLARHLTDFFFWNIGWVHFNDRARQGKSTSVWIKKRWKECFLGHVLRAERGWSGALMIADFGNVQESEASEIYAKRFQSQEVPVKIRIRISVCKWNVRILGRPRPSSIAEENIEPEGDVEIEEGDKKGRKTEDSWSLSGEFMNRHYEEPQWKFYDTFPIP